MKSLITPTLCLLSIACGPPAPAGGGGGGGGSASQDAGTPADAGDTTQTPTICDLHELGVLAGCVGCHGNGGGVSIDHSSPQALYDSLVGVSGNSGNDLVVSGDADASWLWVRMSELNGESSMPPTGALDETVRNPVRDWINGGSLDECL